MNKKAVMFVAGLLIAVGCFGCVSRTTARAGRVTVGMRTAAHKLETPSITHQNGELRINTGLVDVGFIGQVNECRESVGVDSVTGLTSDVEPTTTK